MTGPVCIIPARMASNRFPGKPLVPLLGLALVLHVYERCRLYEEFSDVVIIENEVNKGFTAANNQAIEIARSRYVLLLNADTIVIGNAITKTIDFADLHPECAVVGCRVLNPDRTLQRSCFLYPSLLNNLLAATYLYKLFPRNRFFARERMGWFRFDQAREVETVCGCCSLVRTEAIQQVGVMDVAYVFYGDDPDWCYRFWQAGWKVMFTPDPEIIHYGGQATKKLADKFAVHHKFMFQLYGAKLMFIRKHRSGAEFVFACLVQACFFFWRVPYWLVIGALNAKVRRMSINRAKACLVGGCYCLVGWKWLLVKGKELAG